jgi:hypothetical protein
MDFGAVMVGFIMNALCCSCAGISRLKVRAGAADEGRATTQLDSHGENFKYLRI